MYVLAYPVHQDVKLVLLIKVQQDRLQIDVRSASAHSIACANCSRTKTIFVFDIVCQTESNLY